MKHNSLMHTTILIALISIGGYLKSQVYSGNWLKGPAITDQPGIYGTPGTPANQNNPGARDGAAYCKDISGNFWLFGGFGVPYNSNYDVLADLWKYSPSTNQWTFVKGDSITGNSGTYGTIGVASSTNKPGGRQGAVMWADASGNLWMFGGAGYDASTSFGVMNDLWKYNITANQWTWMGGSNLNSAGGTYGTMGTAAPGNVPGARAYSYFWNDASGNFWLFGGSGYSGTNIGDLQDLWKYSPSTNQWTWMKGSANTDVNGVYGTMGTAASGNLPGGRYFGSNWTDASGNLWLFGGAGYDASTGMEDFLNDLWKFDVGTGNWTWVKGSNISAQGGTYGTMNTASSSNVPGGRIGQSGWTDGSGSFYVFGGVGYDATTNMSYLNDMWKYSIATNQWTWLKGSNTSASQGTFGMQGVPSVNNIPSGRYSSATWTDSNNNLWLFSGNGTDTLLNVSDLSDLWKLETCVAPILAIAASSQSVCAGNNLTLTATGAATYSWSTNQTTSTINIIPVNTSTYILTGTTSTGCSNSMFYTQTVSPSTSLTLSVSSPTACAMNMVTVTATGAPNFTWSTGATGSVAVVSSSLVGMYTPTCFPVGGTGCISQGTTTIQFYANPTVTAVSSKTLMCKGSNAVLTATGATSYTWNVTPVVTNQTISVNPNASTNYTVTGTDANGCTNSYVVAQNIQDCTGFENFTEYSRISLYPNPSNGSFRISTDELPENSKLIIFNSLGQQVLVQTLENGETEIDLKAQSGIYIYRIINSQQELKTGKLVIK